ncbi:MAG: DHA2 family efflux MFS transporter permease subunit [Acetobacteraceae bacterium]|nr:DHA2 family efflux MFS transporter permease subunit [Acetobacteraceae bacterium]
MSAARPLTDGVAANRGLLTLCAMLATLMQSLDGTIANVALPYMQGSLGASQDEVNWVLTSYIVAAAIMTAPTGWLTTRFGRTRVFVVAVAGFTMASVLCGMAQSIEQIVLFRLLQGMFGASLVPLSQAVMFDIYPVEQRGSAMALWGIGVMVGPILGPTLGGWLTQNYDWRWVFYINVPVGLLAVAGLLLFLPETERAPLRFDWIGFAMLSLAIGAFQMMLDRGSELDWFSAREIIIEAVLAGLGLYCFLVHFALAEKPFIAPSLFTDVNFVVGTTFIFLVGLILYATLALLTPYLQNLMQYPVLTAGIVLAPRGAGTMLAMFICGRLLGRVSVRVLVIFGFSVTIYSLYLMMGFTPDVAPRAIVVSGFLQGLSVGFVFVSLSTVTFATLPPELRTQGTSIYSLVRNLGSSIGISVTGALLIRNTQLNHASIAANVTPFNHALHSGIVARLWNPLHAGGAAALNAEITRQATIIAYVDDFKLMMLVSALALPLVFMLRKPANVSVAASSHDAVME